VSLWRTGVLVVVRKLVHVDVVRPVDVDGRDTGGGGGGLLLALLLLLLLKTLVLLEHDPVRFEQALVVAELLGLLLLQAQELMMLLRQRRLLLVLVRSCMRLRLRLRLQEPMVVRVGRAHHPRSSHLGGVERRRRAIPPVAGVPHGCRSRGQLVHDVRFDEHVFVFLLWLQLHALELSTGTIELHRHGIGHGLRLTLLERQ